jgi:threonine-phosphate decarboxylase
MSHSHEHGGTVFALSRRLGIAPEEIADFSASINPLGLPHRVRDAVAGALDSLVHYPDADCAGLKQALAAAHGLTTAHVAVANGSTELIYQIPAMLAGRRALIVSPAFSEYGHALAQHGWQVRRLLLSPADGFRLDPAALENALAAGCDALYLCNPGNPSGMLYPPDLIAEVYRLCRASGTFLVLDEAFMDFCEEASAKGIIAAEEHGLVLRSMTKFFGIPGLRLGYALAHPGLIGRLEERGIPWCVNTLAQVAGTAALRDSEYRRQTIEYVGQERSRLCERLSRLPQLSVHPSQANFLLVEVSGGLTAAGLKERLLAQRILIRDCANFAGLDSRFFRIAVRTAEENQRLLTGLEGIFQRRESAFAFPV